MSCQINKAQIPVRMPSSNILVFEGALDKPRPELGFVSGPIPVYRLAKYRMNKVCEGKLDESEIVVDHLVFTNKEFDGININDHVCMTVKVSNKIITRYDGEGIRSPSEDVKTFYLEKGELKPIDPGKTCCN